MKPGLHHNMPEREYHAHPAVNASGLKRILQSPAHYKLHLEPSDAMDLGSAVHTEVLGVGAPVSYIDLASWGVGAKKQREEIRAAGGQAIASTESVAEEACAQRTIAMAVEHFGRIDGVVNNAGILRDRFFHAMSAEEFDAALAGMTAAAPFAVAVSGGADSMALLLLANEWCRAHGAAPPQAVTVDHALREGSASEAQSVATWAAAHGVPHATLRWEEGKKSSNIQSQAREARYTLIGSWMRDLGLKALMTGHTLDDQAETFLIRLARGTGLEGLTGMATVAPFPLPAFRSFNLLRPLLSFGHDRLVATLQARGQQWIEDPSNSNPRFQRARLRSLAPVLAEAGLTREKLASAMGHLRRANDVIRSETAALLARAVRFEPWGYALVEVDELNLASPEVALRATSRLLQAVGGSAYPPEFEQTGHLLDWLMDEQNPVRGRTLNGCRLARRSSRHVLVAREEEVLLTEAPCVTLRPGEACVWDARFEVSVPAAAADGPFQVKALGLEGLQQVDATASMPPLEPNRIARSVPAIWSGGRLLSAPLLDFHPALIAFARFLGPNPPQDWPN